MAKSPINLCKCIMVVPKTFSLKVVGHNMVTIFILAYLVTKCTLLVTIYLLL